MSLTTIPNQPINLTDPVILTDCPDKDPPMLIAEGDPIVFQFLQERCEGAEQYLEPISPSDWIDNPGWTLGAGFASLVVGNGGQYIEESLWTATLGEVYDVEIEVAAVSGGGFFVQVGGTQRAIFTPGTHRFTISAAIATFTRVVAVADTSAGTITSLKVYEANRDFTVAITQGETDVEVYNPMDDPEMFVYNGQHVTFNKFFTEDVTGCFNIELRDNCTGYPLTYCSQPFKVVECREGLVVRTCNDDDAMGFVAGYFQARLLASLVRPSWDFEVSEERLSNGVLNRHFVERQAVYQLSIEIVGASLHQWLAALPMFDHLYIGQTEWSADADGYAPAYGDAQTGNAGALVTVRDPNTVLRRVRCEDIGAGCNPKNDPICNPANADVAIVVSEGQLVLRVDVYSSLGFVVQEIEYSINGVDQTPIPVGGVPGVYGAGDIVEGDVVRVTLVNAKDPLCNDARAALTALSVCETVAGVEGCQHFTLNYLGDNQLYFLVNLSAPEEGQFLTVIAPDGQDYTVAQGEQLDFLGEEHTGIYCAYSSDEDGNPIAAIWNDLNVGGPDPTNVDFSIADLDLAGVDLVSTMDQEGLTLFNAEFDAAPDFTHMASLRWLNLGSCSFPSLPITTGLDLTGYYLEFCGLTTAPSFTGFPNISNVVLGGNSLPSAEVDRVIIEVAATNTTDGLGAITLDNQTPLAPRTSASDAAVTNLLGRTPGWTVNVDS
jgi:hypothetical protein